MTRTGGGTCVAAIVQDAGAGDFQQTAMPKWASAVSAEGSTKSGAILGPNNDAAAVAVGGGHRRSRREVLAGHIHADEAASALVAVRFEKTALQHIVSRHNDAAAADAVRAHLTRQQHGMTAQLDWSGRANLALNFE